MDPKRRRCPAKDISSVLIVDDHPLYSDALIAAFDLFYPGSEIRTAQCLRSAFEVLDAGFAPDLVMFDLKLPDVSGISGFVRLRARLTDTPILVISSLATNELVQSLLREGAAGFFPKDRSAGVLRSALETVVTGGKYIPADYAKPTESNPPQTPFHPKLAALTPQQRRILNLICAGKPNKQIAYELSLAEATVKAHITALLRRLGATNRTQAAIMVEGARNQSFDEVPEARAFLQG